MKNWKNIYINNETYQILSYLKIFNKCVMHENLKPNSVSVTNFCICPKNIPSGQGRQEWPLTILITIGPHHILLLRPIKITKWSPFSLLLDKITGPLKSLSASKCKDDRPIIKLHNSNTLIPIDSYWLAVTHK